MICSEKLNLFSNARSVEELWMLHTEAMEGYGFDRLLYGFTRYRTERSFGDPEDFILLTNHDPSYTDVFVGQGYYTHAPMMRWVLAQDGAISWSLLEKMIASDTLTLEESRVVDFNRSHDVVAGYTISFKSLSPRSKGAISLAARRGLDQAGVEAIWAEHGEDITFLNNLTHLKVLTLPYQAPGRSLTDRQREVLGWVGDGKTTQDIAMLLQLTPATVEKHLRLARDALCVETTAQAVLKASFLNQIFVVKP